MDMIEIEGGEVLANLDDRSITGLLIPYGEMGRTNVGQFEVEAGVIKLPADPVVVGINLDHDRFAPIGRATRVWEEPTKGIMASFAIANTPEGDAALADARDPNGKRRCLSGEFRTGIKAGKATGGVLAGAALVERGAFPSAGVLAADIELATEAATEGGTTTSTDTYISEYTDEDGVTWTRKSETKTTTTTEQTKPADAPADEAEADPEEESEVTASAIPATQRPSAPAGTTSARPAVDLQQVFAAIADFKSNLNRDAAHTVLAALSDIKFSGSGALPAAGVLQPNWVGLLTEGLGITREYITLGNLGTNITAGGKKGYKVKRGTSTTPVDAPFDGEWAGNKTAIKSYGGFTTTHESTLDRFAIGEDIAREFYDLPGGAEVVAAFLSLITEDHLTWSDNKALGYWKTAAGAAVAPTPPADEYPAAVSAIIDGILRVKRKKADGKRDKPTFAIVNEMAYEQLVRTPYEKRPEYINLDISTDGEGTADGIRVVQGDVGIVNSPAALVGAKYAIDFDELAGGPLHIDALDLAKGGVDRAVHGYLQTFIRRPEAVVLVGTADTAGA